MRKNIVWTSCAFAIMLAVVLARTQGRPDFTGTWVVESIERPERPERPSSGSQVRGPGARMGAGPMVLLQEGQRVRIKQSPERLIVTIAGESGEQMNAYALDGSESSNASGRGTVKSKTRWEGVALVTESTRTMEGPRGEVTLKMREVRSLSEDGRTMTLRTTVDTPRGTMTGTVTFGKAEE